MRKKQGENKHNFQKSKTKTKTKWLSYEIYEISDFETISKYKILYELFGLPNKKEKQVHEYLSNLLKKFTPSLEIWGNICKCNQQEVLTYCPTSR